MATHLVCMDCGRTEKVSRRAVALWKIVKDKNGRMVGIRCPECAEAAREEGK